MTDFIPSRQELRIRAQIAVKRPIPASVREGGVLLAREYKSVHAQVYGYATTGRYAARAVAALYRLEDMQGARP